LFLLLASIKNKRMTLRSKTARNPAFAHMFTNLGKGDFRSRTVWNILQKSLIRLSVHVETDIIATLVLSIGIFRQSLPFIMWNMKILRFILLASVSVFIYDKEIELVGW